MELETERFSVLELEVMNMRLRRDLQLFAIHDLLEGLLDQRLDDLLPDGVLEALLDHRRRRLTRPKPRKTDARGVAPRRVVFGVANRFHRNRDLDQAFEAVGLFGGDLNVHRTKLSVV